MTPRSPLVAPRSRRSTLSRALALSAAGWLALAGLATAQAQSAGGTTPAPAAAAVSPAKKELVARVLQLQQPGIETLARGLVEQPAMQMMQQVSTVIRQRVPQDKREALARDIQADVRKFLEETAPVMRDQAIKLAPSTVGAVLEEKMTEEELRQVIAILESPANRKFASLAGEMQRSIAEKLVAETRPAVEGRLRTLELTLQRRLAPYAPGAASAPAGR
jgi:hypothetical protein